MATASSAQREPSMEEILASIRRIIEDSDSGRKLVDEDVVVDQQAGPTEDNGAEPEVDAFRAELRSTPHSEARSTDAGPVSLADVQAQLSASAEVPVRDPAPRPVVSLAEVGAQMAAGHPMPSRNTADADTITADWRRDIAAAGRPALDAPQPVAKATPADMATQANEPAAQEPLPDDAAAASEQPQSAMLDEAQSRPALVSEQTSRQVAAAFGELSEAFASRSRKSFDEMAEEMLRPMLQDWLDNNLPTLVERLVREEIERVARGA